AYMRTDTRADGLLVGALLGVCTQRSTHVAALVRTRWMAGAATVATVALLMLSLSAQFDRPFLYQGGFTLVAVVCAVLTLAVLPESAWIGAGLLAWPPLTAVGLVSYGLYLWHLPIFFATAPYTVSWPIATRIASAVALAALATALSWFVVERPFL